MQVDAEKQKVLYLEGTPRWDFRFLDHALRRDHGVEVTVLMESQLAARAAAFAAAAATPPAPPAPGAPVPAAATQPTTMPLDQSTDLPQDSTKFGEYAAVVLGDISPKLLPPRLQEQLLKAVEEKGTGIIIQAGTEHMPHDFMAGPLGKLLPAKFDPPRDAATTRAALTSGGTTVRGGIEAPVFAPFRMKVSAAGSLHEAFQLYDNATKNREVWSRMPTFDWAAAATVPAPGATVLAEVETAEGTRPLLVEQYYGKGRVLLVGTDSTYRWRRNIGDVLFYRFWGQVVRRVARKPERGDDRSWVEVSPPRSQPGEPVAIELYAVNAENKPADAQRVGVTVTGPNFSESVTLERSAEARAGYFRGTWRSRVPGDFRVSYSDAGGKPVSAVVSIRGSGQELLRPTVDRDGLSELAEASGGQMIELTELDRLPEKLNGEPQTVRRTRQEDVWDNWLCLMLLAGLYCTDLGVRRVLGLA